MNSDFYPYNIINNNLIRIFMTKMLIPLQNFINDPYASISDNIDTLIMYVVFFILVWILVYLNNYIRLKTAKLNNKTFNFGIINPDNSINYTQTYNYALVNNKVVKRTDGERETNMLPIVITSAIPASNAILTAYLLLIVVFNTFRLLYFKCSKKK